MWWRTLVGRSEKVVEIIFDEMSSDLMDDLETTCVRYEDLIWTSSNVWTVFLVERLCITDLTFGDGGNCLWQTSETSIPWTWNMTKWCEEGNSYDLETG